MRRLPSRRIAIGLAGWFLGLVGLGCSPGESAAPLHGIVEAGDLVLSRVSIVDGRGSAPTAARDIVVRGDRIVAILERPVPNGWPGVQVIDLRDRFVVPGFVDMHAHVTVLAIETDGRLGQRADPDLSAWALRQSLAWGVTTVRNPASPTVDGVELRDRVARSEIPGPRIVTAGAALSRTAPGFGPFVAVSNSEEVRDEVTRQVEAGVDCIKVYGSLPPDLVRVAIHRAHELGVAVVGHLQRTTWTEAAAVGMDAITHGAPWSADYLAPADRGGYRGSFRDRIYWYERVDLEGPSIREMIDGLAAAGVTLDPTLVAYATKFMPPDHGYRDRPEIANVPTELLELWQRGGFTDDWGTDEYARMARVWPVQLELVRRLHEAGVLLTVGSDTPNPWVIPGVAFHDELELLVSAGIAPAEVIAMATSNGAKALGLDGEIGVVEVGWRADLVVLDANPTLSIESTRRISMVLQGGQVVMDRRRLSEAVE